MARPTPLWLAASSRFASLKPGRARLVLAGFVLLLLACLTALAVPEPPANASNGTSQGAGDIALYEAIVDGVRYGGDYYSVAADALRAGGYPLRPFLTFRLPALAVIEAHLPESVTVGLQWALALGVALAWAQRLLPWFPRSVPRAIALLLIAGSMLVFVQPGLIAFHEIWAAQFVALSLAIRRPGRWVEAVAVATVALLIRETAALYVVIMAAFAWFEGERREALGWSSALALLLGVLAAHAIGVAGVTGPLDPASPGWLGMHGFGLFVKALVQSTALSMFPLWFAALLVGVGLFGWLSVNDPLALRAAATISAYALVIALFARLDTFYWGLMVAPVFLAGLIFAPDGLRDLIGSMLDRRRVRVQIVGR